MGFFGGLVAGTAGALKEGIEKIDDRIADRTDQASQYHRARATSEQAMFDQLEKDTDAGIRLLQGFFINEPNAAEMAGSVFNTYGGTLEGAQQAAEAGRLAIAAQKQKDPSKKVSLSQFFKFAAGTFDPDNPLTLDDVVNRQIGEFSYTPGEMVNVNAKDPAGFAANLFGNVQQRIGKRINEDLTAMGINTEEPQRIERVLPAMFSQDGMTAMNMLRLSELNKLQADVRKTITGADLNEVQAKLYETQQSALNTKMSTWTEDQKANRDRIYAAIELSGAQAANQLIDNKLLTQFGEQERRVAIDVLVNEAKYKYGADDWEEFDVRIAQETVDLKTQINQAKENGLPQAVIDGLQGDLRAYEQARLSYMTQLGKREQADIISKTSPTTLWSNAIKSGFEDAQLGGVVKFDINGQIREITEGNEFKVALAKYDVLRQFKQQYYGFEGTRQWIDTNTKSIQGALNSRISDSLAHVYKKNNGKWNEGTVQASGKGRGAVTKKVGSVINYSDDTPQYELVQGQAYKVPYEVLVRKKGKDWIAKHLAGTKHYDSEGGFAYAVWGGGRKSDFRFLWNSETANK